MVVDPISNFIIALKNASLAGKDAVSVPYSQIKFNIASLLKARNFVSEVSKKGKKGRSLEVTLRYKGNDPVIHDVARISKSSRRLYKKAKEIFPYRQGVGMTVFSTPKGILADIDARKSNVGGEILFSIW